MAGPSIGTWVKVRSKSGGTTPRVLAKKYGGGAYQQGQVITQSEYEGYKKQRSSMIEIEKTQKQKRLAEGMELAEAQQYVRANGSKKSSLQKLHGMAKNERLKSVTYRGIKIDYPPNANGEAFAADTIKSLSQGKFPEALTKHTKEICFSKQRNRHDPYWAKQYNIPGFKSAATGGDGRVVVYNGKSIKEGTIAHEMGHNLAGSIYGSTTPAEGSRYRVAQSKEKPVSDYGSKSPSEDFADAVKAYVTTPTTFRKDFPLKYEAINRLLVDQIVD